MEVVVAEVVLMMVVCFDGLSPGGGVSLLFFLCSLLNLLLFNKMHNMLSLRVPMR